MRAYVAAVALGILLLMAAWTTAPDEVIAALMLGLIILHLFVTA